MSYLALADTFGPNGQIESSFILTEEHFEIKPLTRVKSQYVSQCTSINNRITKSFDRFNLKIMNLFKQNRFIDTAISFDNFITSGQ